MRNSSKKEKLYAVIGLGRFGFALAKRLAESGKDLIVIDKSETVINDAVAFTDNAYLMADLSKENLRNVGIQNCDSNKEGCCHLQKRDELIIDFVHKAFF